MPVLHLANFPLPETRGDFGAGVVEHMRDGDIFMVIFDYGTAAGAEPLFARRGVPQLRTGDFHGSNLQRTIAGQVGCQHFFQHNGRALCLYVVVGARRSLTSGIGPINAMLARVQVEPPVDQW